MLSASLAVNITHNKQQQRTFTGESGLFSNCVKECDRFVPGQPSADGSQLLLRVALLTGKTPGRRGGKIFSLINTMKSLHWLMLKDFFILEKIIAKYKKNFQNKVKEMKEYILFI